MGSDTLTLSDFLSNAKLQLDAGHFGLDKVKRRLIEYLAVVRMRALIAQEVEMEQTKAQEVTLNVAAQEGDRGTLHRLTGRRRKSGEPLSRQGMFRCSFRQQRQAKCKGPAKWPKPSKPQFCCA